MNERPITLRAANRSLEDGLMFAHYLDQAAEGFFRFMLGRRAAEILAKAFVEPDHDLSYEHVTFAECDGRIVGMVCGYTAEQHRRSSRRPLMQAAGKWNFRMMITSIVFALLLRIIDSIDDEDFYLQAIAVDQEFRGTGVGSLLFDSIEAKATAAGSARLALDASAKNERAVRFYTRRELSIAAQWPKRIWIPGLRLYRMVKKLEQVEAEG